MTSVAPTEQAGSTLAGEGDRSSVTILKLHPHSHRHQYRRGINTPHAGRPLVFAFAIGSIVLIIAVNRATRGFWRALSVFIALVTLYLVAIALGLADFALVAKAPWFRASILPYGSFVWPRTPALITVLVYHLVVAIYTMSITLALSRMLGVEGTERRVRGAVAADGLGSDVAALFGGVPLISYDQNVGATSLEIHSRADPRRTKRTSDRLLGSSAAPADPPIQTSSPAAMRRASATGS